MAQTTVQFMGVGLKPCHYQAILETNPPIGFFEVHAENYMVPGGPPHRYLTAIRQQYDVSIHGVGMSIGGANALDPNHLQAFTQLVERYQPVLVSEHLAWSSHDGVFTNDLLPVPYNKAALTTVCNHIDTVQNSIKRPLLLENPSTYVGYQQSDLGEAEFINQVLQRTGCGLLLDVNNVVVSATNHQYSPWDYVLALDLSKVQEIHLAGHDVINEADGRQLLIDTHDRPVDDEVWRLYQQVIEHLGCVRTLIEWDSQIPGWSRLLAEAHAAERIMTTTLAANNFGGAPLASSSRLAE